MCCLLVRVPHPIFYLRSNVVVVCSMYDTSYGVVLSSDGSSPPNVWFKRCGTCKNAKLTSGGGSLTVCRFNEKV